MVMSEQGLLQELKDISHKLRITSIEMVEVTGTGHPTSCSSIAEIMSVLFFKVMKYDVKTPKDPNNDRFILSKGHAAPILYAAWAEAGLHSQEDIMKLRMIGSDFEGHPTPRLNFVDVATGSLGQGIGVAVGMAYDGKYIDKSSYRVYCIIGDGESMEGCVWEALAFASHYKLENFVVIVDVNKLGQSDCTAYQHDMELYRERFKSFGFHAIVVDGHDVSSLLACFNEAALHKGAPTAILAKTIKGAYFPDIEGKPGWHGKALGNDAPRVIQYLKSHIKNHNLKGSSLITASQTPAHDLKMITELPKVTLSEPPSYTLGKDVATRVATGAALLKAGKSCDKIVVCDADVKNSTYTDAFKQNYPERFVDCFIAEQNCVSVATGLATRSRHIVFLSTFAAFITRAYDQIRMGAISFSHIKLIGTHCGVSIGEDGNSQMGLEDISLFRAIPGCVVLYPSDAVSAERSIELAANIQSMVYIRVSRPATPVVYSNTEIFEVGRAKVCVSSSNDSILVVTGGVTLIECIKASQELKTKGINVRVMDLFSIKPIDHNAILQNSRDCGNKILTVEDHYPEGGLGEAVAGCVSEAGCVQVHKLCVTSLPRSGKGRELLELYGLTSVRIAEKICAIINSI